MSTCFSCALGKFSRYGYEKSYMKSPTAHCSDDSSPTVNAATTIDLRTDTHLKTIWCEPIGYISRMSCEPDVAQYAVTLNVQRAFHYNFDMRSFMNPYWWVRIYGCMEFNNITLTLQNYPKYCDTTHVLDFSGGNPHNDRINTFSAAQVFMIFTNELGGANCEAEDSLELFNFEKTWNIQYNVSVQHNVLPTACFDCPIGTYTSKLASTHCTFCPEGKYNTKLGASSSNMCLLCPHGTYNDDEGTFECYACDEGTYASDNQCFKCDRGFYSSSEGLTSCSPCSSGLYASKTASTQCINCSLGSYISSTGASACKGCEPGSIGKTWNTCVKCTVGTYNQFSNKTSCENCSAGTFTSSIGFSICTNCPPGSFISQIQSTSCDMCAKGKFSNRAQETSSSVCRACEQSTYASADGSSVCTACPQGKSTKGMTQRVSVSDCTTSILNSTCLRCRTCPSNALYSLGTCNAKAGNAIDDTHCVCPAGMFYDSVSNFCIKCLKCPENAWTFMECEENSKYDTTICRCKAGFYGNPFARCLPCPQCFPSQNTFPKMNCGPDIQHEAFIQGCQCLYGASGYGCCLKGMYCPQNSSKAFACERGKYSPKENMSACLQCPGLPSQYANRTMATTCTFCAENSNANAKVSCS